MPKVVIPYLLQLYVNNQKEVVVHGTTVGAALEDLFKRHPDLSIHLCKGDGSLRAYVNIVVDGLNIKNLQNLDTPIGDEDVLTVVPSLAGG